MTSVLSHRDACASYLLRSTQAAGQVGPGGSDRRKDCGNFRLEGEGSPEKVIERGGAGVMTAIKGATKLAAEGRVTRSAASHLA
jgi:hypothetical protein